MAKRKPSGLKGKPRPLTFGKAYRLSKRSKLIGLLLPVGPRQLAVVYWNRGKLRVRSVTTALTAVAIEPNVKDLCDGWGISISTLDAFIEEKLYNVSQDVAKVRADEERKAR